MIKYLSIFVILSIASLAQKSAMSEHVMIKLHVYESEGKMKASPTPRLKAESELVKYQRRFEYLIINIPEINLPEKFTERKKIFDLYPDTSEMKRLYFEKIVSDKKLTGYFQESTSHITNPNSKVNTKYTTDELMEIASKFFYCDQINPDTTVQSHVCVGINGLKEVKWERDYTLLSAFCYEAIFHDFDKDTSQVSETYLSEKKKSCQQFRGNITTLDSYLENVKTELYKRMKSNSTLKKELLAYYESHKSDLAFSISQ